MGEYVNFDRFRFEPVSGRLWAGGAEVRLTPRSASVLGFLIAQAGRPVTKQDLFAAVWQNRVVSDDALSTCVQELRRALTDDAKNPRYIETRHRSGYQFVAPITRSSDAELVQPDAAAIAVLPFADMSATRDQDYFCEGLAEELIDALTHVDGLRVAARSLSFQFRGPSVNLHEVGEKLNVGSVLEGSVRREGERLRITVQLIELPTGYHKWSQRFERARGDVFAIQDEIAETVATMLRGDALSSRERTLLRRQHTAADTYEYFLRGRQSIHKIWRPDLEHSREMFERAIALDEKYAPAWAGVATVHALLYEWWGARDEDLERAEHASEAAMRFGPELADAHVARGFALSLRRRYDEAEQHFEKAARINPHLFDAYYYYGRACFARGEVERSADLFRRAAEVRREDFQSPLHLAQSLRMLGRLDEANAAGGEGIARAERVLALNPLDGRALSLTPGELYTSGQHERAFEWSRRSLELYPDDMGTLLNAACLRLRARKNEEALDLIERAFSKGWGKRDWIEHDPDFDSLRDNPRFQALLEKLK